MAATPSWIIIAGASVSGAILLVCLFVGGCLITLACLYSTQCVWCPCNRKRGQAHLQYMGSRGNSASRSVINIRISKRRTETGVTIYRGPNSKMELVSPTLSVESSNISSMEVVDSSFLVESGSNSLQTCKDSRESCIYVVPSNMSNGFEPTGSWGLALPETGFILNKLITTSGSTTSTMSRTSCFVVKSLSRVEAENSLKKCGIVGCFLFRNTSKGICLSVLAPDQKCRHLVIDHVNSNYYKIKSLPTGSECFSNLEELVAFYTSNEVHFQDGGFSIKLSKLCY